MDFKDFVKNIKFHTQKKESYSLEDIYQIEDQLKNKIASKVDEEIREVTGSYQKEIADLKAKLEENKKTISELENVKQEFTKVKEVATKYKDIEFKNAIKGLVVDGAEQDIKLLLGDKLKEIETSEDFTEQVKSLVTEVVKEKPYLAPKKAETNELTSKTADIKEKEEVVEVPKVNRVPYIP